MNRPTGGTLAAGLLAAFCALGLYQLGALRAQSQQLATLERRLASIEGNQKALQDAYLSGNRSSRQQLAARLGYRPTQAPPTPGLTAPGGMKMLSPAALRQAVRETYQQHERTFNSEPVNPAWAGKTRQNVEDALYQIAQQGVVPQTTQIDCRSRSCRISLNLADSTQVDALTQTLLTEIASDLPSTTMLQIPSPDGQRIDLHIFATKAPSNL